MSIPSMTIHAMKRYQERAGRSAIHAMQEFMKAKEVCRSVSGKYNNRSTERRFRYNDRLIFVYEPQEMNVITVIGRDEINKYEAMIREFEA